MVCSKQFLWLESATLWPQHGLMRTLRSVSTKSQKWRQELHLALTVQRWKFHEKLLNRWQLQVQSICQLKSMKVFSANSVTDSPTSYARVRSEFFTVKLLNASSAPKFFELFFFLFFLISTWTCEKHLLARGLIFLLKTAEKPNFPIHL